MKFLNFSSSSSFLLSLFSLSCFFIQGIHSLPQMVTYTVDDKVLSRYDQYLETKQYTTPTAVASFISKYSTIYLTSIGEYTDMPTSEFLSYLEVLFPTSILTGGTKANPYLAYSKAIEDLNKSPSGSKSTSSNGGGSSTSSNDSINQHSSLPLPLLLTAAFFSIIFPILICF